MSALDIRKDCDMDMHLLSNSEAIPSPLGTVYRARCRCGLDIYGVSLPKLWQRHQDHIELVKQASMNNHPSRKEKD